ncbi:hydroxyacylglutathione hydrolase [Sphingomonas morindae]|uniref:Hydroxyacylglutathione hydrolase n=1 Tax=Sphingomonas morindae TaxID=1541170 RepID=A0ABY4XCE3_9SPHN|nr:hydroxyacylglutathione hydrolase [Sphingomonas morindae]USI74396.1 hydroxyacylglutathione hydrolase [Sphingomonas morindae]
MQVEIIAVPVLADNYIWLMHDPDSGETVAVDPGVGPPVLAEAERRGWRISQVWNTHWHKDHVGGNAAIKAATGARITGPAAEAERIGTLDRLVREGDLVTLGAREARVLAVGAHTAGHIAFHLPADQAVFTGDTLFAMGCGRLFEGDAADMFAALAKLRALPAATRVYCGHEYTLANGRFAATVEPDNVAIRSRLAAVEKMRAEGRPTLPSTIGAEHETNPFLRAPDVASLAARRAAKDGFSG